ncbi:hypothetical protein GCM10010483_09540 [Actinokineospora diospyrosa]
MGAGLDSGVRAKRGAGVEVGLPGQAGMGRATEANKGGRATRAKAAGPPKGKRER